jgi:hypothetical protein
MKNRMPAACSLLFFGGVAVSFAGGFGLTGGELRNVVDSIGTASLVYTAAEATTYGNYCGPGWSGGVWNKTAAAGDLCTEGAVPVSPKDDMDKLCMDHDKAYCSATAAQQDAADKALIDGLNAQKPGINARMVSEGCSTVTSAAPAAAAAVCTPNQLSDTNLDLCVKASTKTADSLSGRSGLRSGAASASGASKAVKASAVSQAPPRRQDSGNGIMLLGGGNGAVDLGGNVAENVETCAALSAKMAYIDAAITGLTAKRDAYAKAQELLATEPILCYNPWRKAYYYVAAGGYCQYGFGDQEAEQGKVEPFRR